SHLLLNCVHRITADRGILTWRGQAPYLLAKGAGLGRPDRREDQEDGQTNDRHRDQVDDRSHVIVPRLMHGRLVVVVHSIFTFIGGAPHRSAVAGRRDRAPDDASIATAQAACHAPASEAVTAVTGSTHHFLDAA